MAHTRLPTYFVSHGGGPWPYMKAQLGATYDKLEASLQDIPRQLGMRPKAVLIVSGHWETSGFTVMATPRPPMIYDYGGFPEHTYHVQYPAPGAPSLALRVQALLGAAGLPATLDDQQGYDHGTFVPMSVMYPDADVPLIQFSIRHDYDPATHLAAGRALAPLRDEGVLVVGSGLTYHNMRNMGPAGKQASAAFDRWLDDTLVQADPQQRRERLLHWTQAPCARAAHPREDHLLPLMVAVGAAEQDRGTRIYHEEDVFGGIDVSSFRFGG